MRGRLLPALVDGEDKAAVQKLLVDVHGRRRQEDHHRPLDAVFLRHHAAGVRVLARRGDASVRPRICRSFKA